MVLNVLSYHPVNACGHEGFSHLSSGLALRFFIAMQVQHSYNYSRSHAFRYGRQKKNPDLTRIELTTCALAGVRGYLLDHSGDEDADITNNLCTREKTIPGTSNRIMYRVLTLTEVSKSCVAPFPAGKTW